MKNILFCGHFFRDNVTVVDRRGNIHYEFNKLGGLHNTKRFLGLHESTNHPDTARFSYDEIRLSHAAECDFVITPNQIHKKTFYGYYHNQETVDMMVPESCYEVGLFSYLDCFHSDISKIADRCEIKIADLSNDSKFFNSSELIKANIDQMDILLFNTLGHQYFDYAEQSGKQIYLHVHYDNDKGLIQRFQKVKANYNAFNYKFHTKPFLNTVGAGDYFAGALIEAILDGHYQPFLKNLHERTVLMLEEQNAPYSL